MQTEKLPTIHVTNYQQYVNAEFLQQAIADNIDPELDAFLPENLYVSIAYIDIKRVSTMHKTTTGQPRRAYLTTLALSIKGKTYSYTLMHDNTDLYLAKVGLDVNEYANQATKDNHIRLLNQAFEGVVFMRAGRITNDITDNFVNVK